jgi:DNA recombination protein RmuC
LEVQLLQIVSLLWQNQRQTKNVKDIIDSATKLYEKFATFSDTFVTLGERLQSVGNVYEQARNQITDGRGNFARQLESFKEKGAITNKSINAKLLEDSSAPELE